MDDQPTYFVTQYRSSGAVLRIGIGLTAYAEDISPRSSRLSTQLLNYTEQSQISSTFRSRLRRPSPPTAARSGGGGQGVD